MQREEENETAAGAGRKQPATPPGDPRLWRPGTRALTTGLVLTVVFTAFEALAVATILPKVVEDIGGLSLYGWAFSAFMLANLVGILAAGRAADRHAPTPVFLLGTGIFAAGLVAAGAAPTMSWVVVARAFQGLGAGAISTISYLAVGRGYSAAARPRMIAALSSAWVVPGLVGPALAGWIADTAGWRWVFHLLAPAALLGAALAVPGLRRIAPSATDDSAVAGAAATSAPPAPAGLYPSLFTLLLIGFVFFGAEVFIPLALIDLRGLSATQAGLPLTIGSLLWTAGAWVQAREAPRRHLGNLVASGLLLIVLGIGVSSLILDMRWPAWSVGPGWAIASLGMGIAYSTAALAVLECIPAGREGSHSSWLALAVNLGTAIGTALAGAIVAWGDARDVPLARALMGVNLLMAIVGLAAVASSRRMPARSSKAGSPESAR